jgi:hypothetical protein
MEIRQGISTDYSRERWDIALDETDLARLALEYKYYGANPDGDLTTMQAARVLSLEADRFVLVQAPKFGRPYDVCSAQLRENREQFAEVMAGITRRDLSEIRKMMGLPDASP